MQVAVDGRLADPRHTYHSGESPGPSGKRTVVVSPATKVPRPSVAGAQRTLGTKASKGTWIVDKGKAPRACRGGGMPDASLERDGLVGLAAQVGRIRLEGSLSLVTAESCTGGLIGHVLTEVAGSSAYYLGGAVSTATSSSSGCWASR